MAGGRRNSTPRRLQKQVSVFPLRGRARSPRSNEIPHATGHPLLVKVKDVLTFGEELEVPVDLVVLAVGQEPNNIADLVEKMKIPVGADRFLQEVHPKLRPVEVSVAGILLAGTCQAPFDVGETCGGGGGRGGQGRGGPDPGLCGAGPLCGGSGPEPVHRHRRLRGGLPGGWGSRPWWTQMVDGQKVRRAQVNPALCLGCGACVAVCPENAINVQGWTLKQYEAMVDMHRLGRVPGRCLIF